MFPLYLDALPGPSASERGAALLAGLAAGALGPADLPALSPVPVPLAAPPSGPAEEYARFRDLHQRRSGGFTP